MLAHASMVPTQTGTPPGRPTQLPSMTTPALSSNDRGRGEKIRGTVDEIRHTGHVLIVHADEADGADRVCDRDAANGRHAVVLGRHQPSCPSNGIRFVP